MIDKVAAAIPPTGPSAPSTGADFGKQLAKSLPKGAGAARPPEGKQNLEGAVKQTAGQSQPAQAAQANQASRVEATRGAQQAQATRKTDAVAPARHNPVERPGGTLLLQEVQKAQTRLDQILKMAESGRTFSPAELIAFQAHTYRASQELEMAGKIVEKGTSAVKQTLQTQV